VYNEGPRTKYIYMYVREEIYKEFFGEIKKTESGRDQPSSPTVI
jgi:hypothetical protein